MSWIGDRLSEYRNFLGYVLLSAPEKFPVEDFLSEEEQMDLDKAFAELFRAFPMLKQRTKDENLLSLAREVLQISYEGYKSGNEIRGAHALQEFEGLLWPSRKLPEEYVLEARERIKSKNA